MPTPLANVMLRSKLVTLGVWNLKTIDVDGELDNKAFNSYGQGPAKPLKSHWTQWWVSKKAFNGDSQTLRKSIDATGSCEEKHYHPITPRKWPFTSRTKPKPKRPFSLLKHEKISPFFRGSPPCAIFHQLQYTAENRRSRTAQSCSPEEKSGCDALLRWWSVLKIQFCWTTTCNNCNVGSCLSC